jgi:hypothetical protein
MQGDGLSLKRMESTGTRHVSEIVSNETLFHISTILQICFLPLPLPYCLILEPRYVCSRSQIRSLLKLAS